MTGSSVTRVLPSHCLSCGYEAGAFERCPECGGVRRFFDLPASFDPSRFQSDWRLYSWTNAAALPVFAIVPLWFDFGGAVLWPYSVGGIAWMASGVLMFMLLSLRLCLASHRMLIHPTYRLATDVLIAIGGFAAIAVGNELRLRSGTSGVYNLITMAGALSIGLLPFVHTSSCISALARSRGYKAVARLRRFRVALIVSVVCTLPLFLAGVAPAFNAAIGGLGLPGTGVGLVATTLLLVFTVITVNSGKAAARALNRLGLSPAESHSLLRAPGSTSGC